MNSLRKLTQASNTLEWNCPLELTLNKQFSDRTLRAVAGGTSVPQIFVNGAHIGGADDLEKWLAARKASQ